MSGFGTGHVWRAAIDAAGAATWTDISGTAPSRLPDIPVNSLAIEPAAPGTMYAGTDIGVFRTTDGGASWSQFSQGLPNCAVYDLKLHNPSRLLRAGTHGRGLWERKLDAVAMPDVNVFVRDNLMESGRDAASATGTTAGFDDPLQHVVAGSTLYWFMCADIKVDALEGNPPAYQMAPSDVDYVAFERWLQHRNPRRGNVNRVYVQLHNRGVRPANGVTVKLLAANATAGLPPLPADFWNVFPADSADASAWTPVGAPQVIPSLSPTQPAVLGWDWSTPMSAADHTCLLVICDCPDDPIPAASRGFDVATLVRGERHAGLKNVHVVSTPSSSPYWTPFAFFGNAGQPQVIRIPRAAGCEGVELGSGPRERQAEEPQAHRGYEGSPERAGAAGAEGEIGRGRIAIRHRLALQRGQPAKRGYTRRCDPLAGTARRRFTGDAPPAAPADGACTRHRAGAAGGARCCRGWQRLRLAGSQIGGEHDRQI